MSMAPNVRIARINNTDELFIENGVRAVRAPARGIARYLNLNRNHLRVADVRSVADEILAKPQRVGGRIERCAEMDDPDRGALQAGGKAFDEAVNKLPPCPKCGLKHYGVACVPESAANDPYRLDDPMLVSPTERRAHYGCHCVSYAGDNSKCPYHNDEKNDNDGAVGG